MARKPRNNQSNFYEDKETGNFTANGRTFDKSGQILRDTVGDITKLPSKGQKYFIPGVQEGVTKEEFNVAKGKGGTPTEKNLQSEEFLSQLGDVKKFASQTNLKEPGETLTPNIAQEAAQRIQEGQIAAGQLPPSIPEAQAYGPKDANLNLKKGLNVVPEILTGAGAIAGGLGAGATASGVGAPAGVPLLAASAVLVTSANFLRNRQNFNTKNDMDKINVELQGVQGAFADITRGTNKGLSTEEAVKAWNDNINSIYYIEMQLKKKQMQDIKGFYDTNADISLAKIKNLRKEYEQRLLPQFRVALLSPNPNDLLQET